ncbi:MAG: hypothetical protein AAF581_11965 [Planctomycetota bacterium]
MRSRTLLYVAIALGVIVLAIIALLIWQNPPMRFYRDQTTAGPQDAAAAASSAALVKDESSPVESTIEAPVALLPADEPQPPTTAEAVPETAVPSGTLIVEVTSLNTGQPAAGVLIIVTGLVVPIIAGESGDVVNNRDTWTRMRTGATDANGRITFDPLPAGVYMVEAPGGVRRECEIVADEQTLVHLEIREGGLLRGFVIGPRGDGLPGASIWVSIGGSPERGGIVTKTRGDGSFVLPYVLAYQWVGAQLEGYIPSRIRKPRSRDEQLNLYVMPAAATASITVKSPDGSPIFGAEVRVYVCEDRSSKPAQDTLPPSPVLLTTDHLGAATCNQIPGRRTYRPLYVARARGYRETRVATTRSRVEITMDLGISCFGTVVGEQGVGRKSRLFLLRQVSPTSKAWELTQQQYRTDNGGRFDVHDLPTSCRLLAMGPGGIAISPTLDVEDTTQEWIAELWPAPRTTYKLEDQRGVPLVRWPVAQHCRTATGTVWIQMWSNILGEIQLFGPGDPSKFGRWRTRVGDPMALEFPGGYMTDSKALQRQSAGKPRRTTTTFLQEFADDDHVLKVRLPKPRR